MDKPVSNSTAILIRVTCAILFLSFSFIYLYCYQADLMTFVQHIASGGETQYQPLIGAILITIVLKLLQSLVFRLAPLTKSAHAFTYFPSMLALAILTDVTPERPNILSVGTWTWLAPILLALFALVSYFLLQLQTIETSNRSVGFFSRRMWINLLTLTALMLMTAAIGNSNDSFHHRLRMENALRAGDLNRYRQVAPEAIAADSTLATIKPKQKKTARKKPVRKEKADTLTNRK